MIRQISRSSVAAFLYGLSAPWLATGAVVGVASRAPFPDGDLAFFAAWVPLIVLSSAVLAAYAELPATRFVPVAAFGASVALVGFPLVTGGGGPVWAALNLFGLVFASVGAAGAQLRTRSDPGIGTDRLRSYVLTAAFVGCASLAILAVGEVSAPYRFPPALRRALVTGLLVASPVAGFAVVRYAGVRVPTLLSGMVLFPFLAVVLDHESIPLAAGMAGLVAVGALIVSVGRGLDRW